jgi:ADP-dependent NAD(P)H-hydrate dehydratase / NAD(P)H-hydrate epimerase
MKLVTVDQMRSIETAADASGHSFAQMMELAGSAVARVIQDRLDVRGKRILLLIGPGNNGGDGLVAARVLKDAGADIGVYLLKGRDDELIKTLRERSVLIAALPDDRGLRFLHLWLSNCDLIIDALLGTGSARPISGDLAKLLNPVNAEVATRRAADTSTLRSPAWPSPEIPAPLIVAVDGPTGLNYDTGELDPNSLSANISVTFAYPKIGHARLPGARAVGELIVADIGIDPQLAKDIELELAEAQLIRSLLPARPIDAHKGTFGKALIVAGSIEYTGAPILSATAAYRSGAGLVTLATPRSIHAIISNKINEATFLPLPDQNGALSAEAVEPLIEMLKTYDAVLIGPGLSLKAQSFIDSVFNAKLWPPPVVDADALTILAQIDQWWTRVPALAILTPHPGEMSRLTKIDRDQIEADRLGIARKFAAGWGQVVVLKGAFTVIAAPDGRSISMPFANPALATAGSGDVLAGVIVSMRAQGLAAYEAAIVGTYLHGLAGEIARREIGLSGVLAGDLLLRLPQAIKQCSAV